MKNPRRAALLWGAALFFVSGALADPPDAGILVASRGERLAIGLLRDDSLGFLAPSNATWTSPSSPVFAGDADRVLFTAHPRTGDGAALDLGVSDLYLRERGRIRRLSDGGWNISSPSADARGTKAVYTARRFHPLRRTPRRIFLLNLASAARNDLGPSRGDGYHPDLSPDGTKVLYRREDGPRSGIYLIDVASGRHTRLLADGDFPRFSPDGREAIFLRDGRLMRIDRLAAGVTPRSVEGTGNLIAFFPRWRGNQILFVFSRRGRGGQGVATIDIASGRLATYHEGDFEYSGVDVRLPPVE